MVPSAVLWVGAGPMTSLTATADCSLYPVRPGSLRELLSLSDEGLQCCDVARANLLAAEGLPGADGVNIERSEQKLDAMARRVVECMNPAAFERRPAHWDYSFSLFRVHVLVSILQREFGLRYNPAKIPIDVPLAAEDSFIYGVLDGPGGTCATLPVVLVAVGRRLGYPLRLVSARCESNAHLFARWDQPGGERFNIELSADGFSCPDDEHYRTGFSGQQHYQTKPEWEARGIVLKSQTPRQELAGFLAQRGCRWNDLGNLRLAADAVAWASAFVPQHDYLPSLRGLLRRWREALGTRRPAGFPPVQLLGSRGRYPPGLPLEVARQVTLLTAIEFLLNDPTNERRWWGPMRRGVLLPRRLTGILVQPVGHGFQVRMLTA